MTCPRCGKPGLIAAFPYSMYRRSFWPGQRACTTCVAWVSQVVAQIPFKERV